VLHSLWPQAGQEVLMTIMLPHLQQYGEAGIVVEGGGRGAFRCAMCGTWRISRWTTRRFVT
jgi:hypothetical protein